MYKLLNDGDIIYNSKTGPNVGKVATLWGLVPNVFIRLIRLRFFSLQEKKKYVSTNKSICIRALQSLPHKC